MDHAPPSHPATPAPARPDPRTAALERLHVASALFAVVLLGFPTTYVEWACLPLLVVSLARLPATWRTYPALARDPLVWCVGAWFAWMLISLTWSANPAQGAEEAGIVRFSALLLFGLWPILARRRLFVATLAIGLLCGNASQLAHAIGQAADIPAITWNRLPGRNAGWWDPVVGGSLLCAALGMHLAGALTGVGRTRLLAIGALLVTVAGLGATGTRGAWIGAILLIPCAVGFALTRVRQARRAFLAASAVTAGVLLGAALTWLLAGNAITSRVRTGAEEVERAINLQDYNSDTGARILMARVAIEAFAAHPVRGVGAGAFKNFARESSQIPGAPRLAHDHAHDAALHSAATTGLVGTGLLLAILTLGVAGGLRTPNARPGAPPPSGYQLAPAFALMGLALAGLFDSVQVNAQTGALAGALLVLCLPTRPSADAPADANREAP